MRRVTNTCLLFWFNLPTKSLTEHFLQGNVPLRHLINAKNPFMSRRRSAIIKVSKWFGPLRNRSSNFAVFGTDFAHMCNEIFPGVGI